MMWNTTAVSSVLNIRYPIIQGPFGSGLSSEELTALVSNLGGLGSFGANHLSPEHIVTLCARMRAKTTNAFAINLWVSPTRTSIPQSAVDEAILRMTPFYEELGIDLPTWMPGPDYETQLQAILDSRPPVFSFVFGIPDTIVLETCRRRGIVTMGTVTSVIEAQEMELAGVDIIVVSGMEAGGHKASFLTSPESSLTGTFALVPIIADQVRTPIVAAGGIADARGIKAALQLGAQGVQIGTAFLACRESNAPTPHKAALFAQQQEATILTKALSGRLARAMGNRLSTELEAHPAQILPYPAQAWLIRSLREAAASQNRSDLLPLWCGQAAPLLRYKDAHSLFESLVRGMSTETS